MRTKKWTQCVVLVVVATMFATIAAAQVTTGRLIGTVVDQDGVALPGATIKVDSEALIGGERATVTDANGEFLFPALPVGKYTVTSMLDGFVTQQWSEVTVELAGATPIFITMPQGTFTDVVEVTAESPVIDTTQVSTEQIFDATYLQNAAIGSGGRSYTSMLLQAAGADNSVESSSNPSVFGSTSGENTYYIDGMDTTDPITSTWAQQLNFDVIQEVQLQSAGYEAEYGRTIGGVVNVLTKSGGNSFSGTLDARFRNSSFYESGDHYDASNLDTQRWEVGLTLGGPLVRDKLWFFASYKQTDSDFTPSFNPDNTQVYKGKYPFGKLTWQAGQNWRVVGKYSGDPVTIDNDEANSTSHLDPASQMNRDQGGYVAQAELNGVLSDRLMWNTIVGVKRSTLERLPVVGPDVFSHWSYYTDLYTQANYRQDYGDRDRDEFATDLTWFVDDFGGSHEFKFGVEYGKFMEVASTICNTAPNNGTGEYGCAAGGTGSYFLDNQRYEDFQHPYYWYITDNVPPQDFIGDMYSYFAQDAWRPVANLTIKAGLRWDDMTWSDNEGTERIWFEKLQPRIGFAWDITSDAKNVVRANWGRFMHPANTSVPGFLTTTAGGRYYYASCTYGGLRFGWSDPYLSAEQCQALAASLGYDYITDNEGWDPAGWLGPFATYAAGAPTEVDPNLKPTYADEYGISYERAVGKRASIEIAYVNKKTRDILEDTCRGNFYDGPSQDADCGNYLIFNHPFRDYDGITVKFETRRYSWMTLLASYTYSNSKGNADTRHYFYGDWDQYPWDWTNMYGYTMYHRPNRVKLNGFFNVRGDWTFGFDFYWADKFRYNTYTDEAIDPDTPVGTTWLLEPRGTRKGNTYYNLDLQVSKGFRIGDRVRMVLIGSVFNVTSVERPMSANDVCEDYSNGCYSSEVEDIVPIGTPIDWSDPRRYEVGFRIEF